MSHSVSERVRALPTPQYNLPAPLNSFIGRAHDRNEIIRRLRAGRLVTLIGPAGVGKTRLALEVAGSLIDKYRDGVWLVELAPLRDSALVLQAIATVLGVRQRGRDSLLDELTDTLASRELLLVLDNCEHVVEECANTADALLRASARLTVLATSRERLQATAEAVWPLQPLGLPDPAAPTTVQRLLQSEAGRLFVERARAAAPHFIPSAENAAVLVDICRRLDGLPLAIELAAVCVRTLAVDDIAVRLDDRFSLLAQTRRAVTARHRTLRAAIRWRAPST